MALVGVYVPKVGKENLSRAVAPSNKPKDVNQGKRSILNDLKNKPSSQVALVAPYSHVSRAEERLCNNAKDNGTTSLQYSSVYHEQGTVTSFSSRMLPDNVHDIDTSKNVNLCPQFAADIYDYLIERENAIPISATFMKRQKYVTSNMRNILVDWLVQVHRRFDLLVETLYLTVSIVDRYLEVECVAKEKFQLVGITATMVACKFEEIYSPEIKDLVYVTDNAYTKKNVLEMEVKILTALDFVVGRPLPIQFLRRISRAADSDPKTHATAKYLMELSLVDHRLSSCQPSLLAASAFYLAKKALHPGSFTWDNQVIYYSGYRVEDVKPVVRNLANNVLSSSTGKLKAIFEKYADRKNLKVSFLPQLRETMMLKLAKF